MLEFGKLYEYDGNVYEIERFGTKYLYMYKYKMCVVENGKALPIICDDMRTCEVFNLEDSKLFYAYTGECLDENYKTRRISVEDCTKLLSDTFSHEKLESILRDSIIDIDAEISRLEEVLISKLGFKMRDEGIDISKLELDFNTIVTTSTGMWMDTIMLTLLYEIKAGLPKNDK